jgi:hypothetical protein
MPLATWATQAVLVEPLLSRAMMDQSVGAAVPGQEAWRRVESLRVEEREATRMMLVSPLTWRRRWTPANLEPVTLEKF